MSKPLQAMIVGTLRIAVRARDACRQATLAKLVADAGHQIVAAEDAADVVLSDSDVPTTDKPVVTLGAGEHDQAGSLPHDADAAQIDAALRSAAAGLYVRPADESRGFGAARERDPRSLLTPREVDVLSAIAAGQSNKAIALRFDISLHTVKFHVESLFRKLGARTRAEAVAKGLERRRAETIEL
jgi:DNA-binding NarL/FixJ family response regulator